MTSLIEYGDFSDIFIGWGGGEKCTLQGKWGKGGEGGVEEFLEQLGLLKLKNNTKTNIY